MSVLAQVPLKSTYLQMTHLLTPYWTPVREGRSRRSSRITAWILSLHTAVRPRPVLPGSPPPTTPWDHKSKSLNASHPSPSHWKQLRLMSQYWLSRYGPSHSCHVTFINTNQRGRMMEAPHSQGWMVSCRTINLFLTPAPLAELWHLWRVAQSGC